MKIKVELVSHDIAEDHISLLRPNTPDEVGGFLRSDDEAQFIMDCLKEDTTKDEILSKLLESFEWEEGNQEQMKQDIDMVLDNLRSVGMLEE